MDAFGITQSQGDKALIVSGVDASVKPGLKKPVSWGPGSTIVFEMDFQVGLTSEHVEEVLNGVAVQLGDENLTKGTCWVLGIGISPEGKWLVRGNAPHWENLKPLPDRTIVVRPSAGETAVSKWFHFKLSSLKSATPNVFKTQLLITDSTGKTVLEHEFSNAPVVGAMTALWELPTVTSGLSVKQGINGLVCVDNISLPSKPAPKAKTAGLGALLQQQR